MNLKPSIPVEINDNVKALINVLNTDSDPIRLKIKPEPYAQVAQYIPAVKQKIREAGGKGMYGWSIWHHPLFLMLEAEFHAVWVSPEDELVDITPRPLELGFDEILFLPCPNFKYPGHLVNSVFLNVSDPNNRLVDDLIATFNTHYRLQNEGKLAYQEDVTVPREAMLPLANLQGMISEMVTHGKTRNSICHCSDGRTHGYKFKRCCGKNLDKFLESLVQKYT